MTGLRRTPRIGKVLAAGALIGLAGCHQVPSRPGAPSPLGFGNEPKGGGTTITPAQEADVQISMGRVAEQQGDLDQAMAAYRAALDRDKSRADAYARLAILHDKQGKFRESADLYRKALALRPGDPDIFCDMGYSFYLQRRWAEAEMNLRQSLAVNPEHRRAHNNLALLLVRDNRLGDALAEFGKAGSDPVQAHMNLAFALTIDQRWESARAEYQRALALDPSSQLAKARLDELNNLLAKREPAAPAPDGARRDPALLTAATATAAPPARRGPDGPTAAATPPQSAPSGARRDPALLTTTAVSPSPPQGYRPRTRVAIPSVPAEDGAMQRLWATADSASGAPPPPRPDARARNTAPTAPPQRRDSHPQPDAAPPDDSSTLPLLAIDSPMAAQAGTRGPDRASIPPPQSFEALRTARPDAHPPAVSTPIAPPGALRRPAPQRPARPRLRTRTRTPWIRPGNPPSAPDGPGDPDDRSPGRQPASGGFSWGAPHQRPRCLIGPSLSLLNANLPKARGAVGFVSVVRSCANEEVVRASSPFRSVQGNRPFYTEATGTSMSRSRLFTELFDSRPYISATDTPGVALAPGTCGFPFAITARFPTERFKEDGMMLKKVNRIPPNYSAPSLQSMQGTTCSFA